MRYYFVNFRLIPQYCSLPQLHEVC